MTLQVATVLRATDARVVRFTPGGELVEGSLSPADLQQAFGSVTVDSRTAGPDALFVALRGERVDGHDYVDQALEAGARGFIVARIPVGAGCIPPTARTRSRTAFFFVAPDPLTALQRLAAHWRQQHGAEVIGITGSIGKTTAKEIVAQVLSAKLPVLKSEANLNTEIGLPLMLLRLTPSHRAAVLEMGMYAPGDVARLARIARPQLGVVTNVAPIHLERMHAIDRIARAKSELVAALPPTGLAILNGDDPWTRAMAQASGVAPAVLVGISPDCDFRAVELRAHGLEGLSFTLRADGRRIEMRTRIPGTHTLHACLAAAAIGRSLAMTWEEIQASLEQARLDERQRLLYGPESMLIIDDSYNAAPLSVQAALELLSSAPGTKIAVLGDMLELGPVEERAHRQVGECAAKVADWLVLRGPRSAWIAESARQRGFPASRVLQAETNAEAVEVVRTIVSSEPGASEAKRARTMQSANVEPGQAVEWSVLVKGSRGLRMEEVVQGLRGES